VSLLMLPIMNLVIYLPVTVYATTNGCDKDFYSGNDIFFYDQCATSCSTNTSDTSYLDSSDNAEAIFKYLTSTTFSTLNNQPMNAAQAAGFLGNFFIESGYDPTAIQGGKDYDQSKAYDSGAGAYAFGIAQWDTGRRVALLKYADGQKQSWKDLGVQLSYLKKELEGSEKAIMTDASFSGVTGDDYTTATKQVTVLFERAGNPANDKRLAAAKQAYDKFKDLAASGVSSTLTNGQCSASVGGGNGSIVDTAKALSWTKAVSDGATDHTVKQNKSEYDTALKQTGVYKLGDSCSKAGISCDAFLATVMRYSGVDPDFPCCGADAQGAYLQSHTEKYEEMSKDVKSTDELKPGYILWRSAQDGHPGHVKIYIGDGKEAAASHCDRTGEQGDLALSDGVYHAFRVK
jgi:cell wall-associated NlpC family hydrolase